MKKRIVSMLLALTLVVSGMPVGITAEGVNAAEVSESEVFVDAENETETEEAESVVENKDAYEAQPRPEAGDFYAFNVSKDGKAVGSDGVAYDNVTYLSAETVKSFGAEGWDSYVEICDRIAEEKNTSGYLQSAVIAVDEDGNLIVQRKVSMKLLQTLMGELTESMPENEAADEENQAADKEAELSTQEDAKEIDTDNSVEGEGLHNEASDEENGTDEIDAEEVEETSNVETTVEEDPVEEEEPSTETEEVMTEDVMTEEASTEDASVEDEELLTEEDLAGTADDAAEVESETATEEPVLSAENMELIDEPEVEEFEVVDNAKADLIVDLGYGKTEGTQQFNSILPTDNYFYDQLTSDQKKIYSSSKVLGKGTNKITLKKQYEQEDIYRAMSAYILSEPYKCDWIDTTRFIDITDWILVVRDATTGAVLSRKFDHTDITFAKSDYYTPEIQKAANDKILKIVSEAQEYAIAEYPYFPVYGIVEYFDKWICEHNYYNNDGTERGEPLYEKDKNTGEVKHVGYDLGAKAEPYYYCHSSYGVLLKNYGVCESYALAMTRLLDAVGIPNIYATGDALNKDGQYAGGHAWNYIEMPNGKWYLQDSTWNEVDTDTPNKVDSASTKEYLLCADDTGKPYGRIPDGNRWYLASGGPKPFKFETRSSNYYVEDVELDKMEGEVILSKRIINLLPKQKETLVCNNAYTDDVNVSKVWLSSNEKVAKVDQKGNVTAVAPGIAKITYVVSGISDTCVVAVSQIDSLTFDDGGKNSLTTSGSIVSGKGEEQKISLTVNQKVPVFTAEDLVIEDPAHEGEDAVVLNAAEVLDPVDIKNSDSSVVEITSTLTEDMINLKIMPLKAGKTKITITFGGKKATLNYSVGEKLDEKWFNLEEVDKLVNDKNLAYTGKAYKPKVVLSDEGKAAKIKFKVSYLNNKDAGTASVIITGTGAYGGEIRRTFKINPLPLNADTVDTASLKFAASNLYNGGVNEPKSTVKNKTVVGDKTKLVGLKTGKDYIIRYTNQGTKETTYEPWKVGTYTMQIVGIGNYSGTYQVPVSTTYEIKKTDLKKVKVSVKVNGTVPVISVAIGKNQLPESDYELTYYTDKKCEDQIPGSVFMKKTQYFIKVVPKENGSNIEMGAKSKPIVKSFKTK